MSKEIDELMARMDAYSEKYGIGKPDAEPTAPADPRAAARESAQRALEAEQSRSNDVEAAAALLRTRGWSQGAIDALEGGADEVVHHAGLRFSPEFATRDQADAYADEVLERWPGLSTEERLAESATLRRAGVELDPTSVDVHLASQGVKNEPTFEREFTQRTGYDPATQPGYNDDGTVSSEWKAAQASMREAREGGDDE